MPTIKCKIARFLPGCVKVHTHVELAHKASHVVVLEVFGQNLFGKPALVKHMEAGTSLEKKVGVLLEYQI